MSASAPSGEQIELRLGEQRAVVVEVGGGLRSYEVAGREILDGYDADSICDGARGHVLIPWPNRTRDGRYDWEDSSFQLDISEPGPGNAIHGLLRWRNWSVRERSPSSVVMAHRLHGSPGYPWELELEVRYELGDGGLAVSATATNSGATGAPFGIGFHPYLRAPGADTVDGCTLTLPAGRRLIADERSIPYSSEPVAGSDFDFRESRAIGDQVLDECFGELTRERDGMVRVVLEAADGSARTVLWLDDAYAYVMVFSGDTLAPAVRRRGLAVEPMSCAPNALQTREGLLSIDPGASHFSRWGLSAS